MFTCVSLFIFIYLFLITFYNPQTSFLEVIVGLQRNVFTKTPKLVDNNICFCFLGYRLRDLVIGTSDTSPAVVVPAVDNFIHCSTFEGPVEDGVTQNFPCGTSGRYLIIQLNITGTPLTMCEVRVYVWR